MAAEAYPGAQEFLPRQRDPTHLRRAAAQCRGCDLYRSATQVVFGNGPTPAELMLVGEQPGDSEDREGEPFVGPAGELLSQALENVGIDREQVYVTNAVKHFKWEARGKRRIHKKPSLREVRACTPWLSAELEVVQPRLLVCLGVTAATAVFGKTVRLQDYRGLFTRSALGPLAFVTTHPSALLRMRGRDGWEQEHRRFLTELKTVKAKLTA